MNEQCIHSTQYHNSVSSCDHSTCACEDCSQFHQYPTKDESARAVSFDQTSSHGPPAGRDATSQAAVSLENGTRFRGSDQASATSPTFGTGTGSFAAASAMACNGFGDMPKLSRRRSTADYQNSERVFTQHSTLCSCQGSGVGCDCGRECDC